MRGALTGGPLQIPTASDRLSGKWAQSLELRSFEGSFEIKTSHPSWIRDPRFKIVHFGFMIIYAQYVYMYMHIYIRAYICIPIYVQLYQQGSVAMYVYTSYDIIHESYM